MQTPDMNTGGASLKLALKEKNIDEIEEYFTALERDLDHNQQLLKEQQEQHHLELIALEREHIQLRMEWEREWKEREEALVSTLKSMFVSRERLMVDIRSFSGPLVSIKHLLEEGNPRKWWLHQKPEANPDAPQGAESNSSSSSISKEEKEEEFYLQELIKLEERVRKAEAKKLLKAQRKAERKAKKAEAECHAKEEKQIEKKDEETRDARPKSFWHFLTLGCAKSATDD